VETLVKKKADTTGQKCRPMAKNGKEDLEGGVRIQSELGTRRKKQFENENAS
jgi:hypothetical protein